MNLTQFIKIHREAIDVHIRQRLNSPEMQPNEEARRWWVLNDEALYNWAKNIEQVKGI